MARGPARFSCGTVPFAAKGFRYTDVSFWHVTHLLLTFRLQLHAHNIYKPKTNDVPFMYDQDFPSWLALAGIEVPTRKIIPVCYGGVFATSASQVLIHGQHFWSRIKDSLDRGENIEESHFMERLWAHLLWRSDDSLKDEILLSHASGIMQTEHRGLKGTLYGCARK